MYKKHLIWRLANVRKGVGILFAILFLLPTSVFADTVVTAVSTSTLLTESFGGSYQYVTGFGTPVLNNPYTGGQSCQTLYSGYISFADANNTVVSCIRSFNVVTSVSTTSLPITISAISGTSSQTSTINNPNQDFYGLLILFSLWFYGIYWMFSKKR